jgi:sugar phosphate permease
MPPKLPIFYGWYILAASFLLLFLNSGALISIGIMFKPIIADFGWNRSSLSLVFFVNMTLFALSIGIVGRSYDRYGPKWVIVLSTLCLCAGFIGLSVTQSFWQFFIFYGILAATGLSGTAIPIIGALTSKWFEKGRGLAISLALSGHCLGQFVLVPFFTILVLRYGWRTSYLIIGLMVLLVNISLALLVIKGDPEDLGHNPLGYQEKDSSNEQKVQVSGGVIVRDLHLRQALGTSSYWFFLVIMFTCGSGDFLVMTHLIPLVTDHGISPVTGGNMLAWFGFMGLLGVLIVGPVSDLIGNKIPIAFTFMLRFGLFLLILRYQNLVSFYVFALTFGFTYLLLAPLSPILLGRLYGFSHIGFLAGFASTVHTIGGGFWAFVGGVVFDRTGSYQLVFMLSAVMALIAAFSGVFIKEMRHKGPNESSGAEEGQPL